MNVPSPSRRKRCLEELSADETARLCLLNDQLSSAEAWVKQRAKQSLTAYYTAGGAKHHRLNNNLVEDVQIEAKVTCVLRAAGHPEFREGSDNIVAELDALALPAEVPEEGFSFADFGAAGELPPLVNVQLCALFHDLVHHMLHRDWHRALDIGEIWIDVKLVQQRIVAW
jgi:hypothetical protein